ncbi:MAG: HD domain-containing protein [Bacteroidaceae bacterium]|nr:HD domain-containing protein [Bacteroidaceae bacterium]
MELLSLEQVIEKVKAQDIFHTIGETADSLGYPCYLIGGYVRDLFLNRPTNDVDVMVVGNGIETARALSTRLGREHQPAIYQNFGTAQVKWHGIEIEFVGARRESYDRNSRKPIVEDGTLEDDLNRRDFTINALGICLNADHFGELVDHFEGLYDLEDGIIRTPLDPDITFSDDPLRMMRCIRFATQLNFFIDDETFDALERNKERIKIISAERIIAELNKIMLSPIPSKGLIDLERCGLLELILPEITALEGRETKAGISHKDIFYHTLQVVDNVAQRSDNLWLRWAALLHDVGKPITKAFSPTLGWTFHNHNLVGAKLVNRIFKRMKLPTDERMKYVKKLVELHMRPIVIADEEVTDSAVRRLLFDAGNDIDDLMTLCESDITSRNEIRKQRFLNNFNTVRQKLKDIEEKDRIRNFQPPVDGEEIMRIFELTPCREVGTLKSSIKDAILDGKIPNEHDAAYEFMLKKAAEMGLTPKQ